MFSCLMYVSAWKSILFSLLHRWLRPSEDIYTHQMDVFHDIQPSRSGSGHPSDGFWSHRCSGPCKLIPSPLIAPFTPTGIYKSYHISHTLQKDCLISVSLGATCLFLLWALISAGQCYCCAWLKARPQIGAAPLTNCECGVKRSVQSNHRSEYSSNHMINASRPHWVNHVLSNMHYWVPSFWKPIKKLTLTGGTT